jgi:hypothetical protein
MNSTQTGSVALVAGQQSYDITFPVAFAATPSYFSPAIEMPDDNGEVFETSYAELTATGVRVWLSGVPTSASDGGYVKWLAIGQSGVVPPTPSTTPFTGIRVVELCNRVGRRARGGDFTKLALNGQQDIISAINAALQRLYNALPTYFKEQTQGFVLPAPLAVTGVGVTQYGKFVTGITFTEAQFGQTIILDGDPDWNQIIGENELLVPYMGPTGTVGGTIYGNALHSTTYPLDRIIGNPQFANRSIFPLANMTMQNLSGAQQPTWFWVNQVGLPQTWWPQVFGNSQGKRPIMVLRFAPAPDQDYAMTVRIAFWPKRITMDDYAANTEITVADQFIEKALIPMCVEEFMLSPEYNRDLKDDDLVIQKGQAGEQFCKLQYGQLAASNQVFTPRGF